MKKLLSLLLACVMVLGMTAFATSTQGTVYYYNQDFSKYNTPEEFMADAGTVSYAFPNNNIAEADYSAFVETGKRISTPVAATRWTIQTNANGQKYLATTFTAASQLYFLPENEWIAADNQKYVISFNLERQATTATLYNYLAILGKTGTTHSIAQIAAYHLNGNLRTCYSKHNDDTATNGIGTGHGVVEVNVPKRFAITFAKATEGNLVRDGYSTNSDGVYTTWYAGTSKYLETLTSVAALGVHVRNTYPSISDLKMYVINTDYAFKAERINNDAVSTTASSYKFKFSRPIVSASLNKSQITMKKGTEDFTGFTIGEVKDEVIGTEICTTVEVILNQTLEETSTYSITVPSTVKDEIATEIGTTNNVVEFTTGSHPTFDAEITATGLTSGDDLDTIANKNTTFNVSFKNTSAAANALVFVGIYDDEDNLVGYSFAKSNFAAGEIQNLGFGTKVEGTGMYVKALTFGGLTDLAAGIDFNSTAVEIN